MVKSNMIAESFISQVRNSQIRQPTQKGFSLNKGNTSFANITCPTTEDERLFEAGLWFHHRLEGVRNRLKTIDTTNIRRDKLIRLYAGTINFSTEYFHQLSEKPALLNRLLPDNEHTFADFIT